MWGHAQTTCNAIVISFVSWLAGILAGYSPVHVPITIPQQPISQTWVLDSLKPDENTPFTRGRKVQVSIYLKVTGEGHYVVEFQAGKKKLRPFVLRTVEGAGELKFSGHLSWFFKAAGSAEEIIVSLYQIECSPSRKTEIKTLLKQYKRRYNVFRHHRK